MPRLFADLDPEHGMQRGLWARRIVMTALFAVALLALWDVFGQGQSDSVANGTAATMTVTAPATVRGGLYFQARIDITAHAAVEHPRLVFDEGWLEGMQVNSIEPAADSESSRDGRLVLSYGPLEPGDILRIWLQFQVDPTMPGTRTHGVELDDGTTRLARVDRDLKVLP
jgi:hypothetical protein